MAVAVIVIAKVNGGTVGEVSWVASCEKFVSGIDKSIVGVIARLSDSVSEVEDIIFGKPGHGIGFQSHLEPLFLDGFIQPDEFDGDKMIR